jgi:hypothetical protein
MEKIQSSMFTITLYFYVLVTLGQLENFVKQPENCSVSRLSQWE